MAIRRISLDDFESYNIQRYPNILGLVSEQDWFADDESNLLGTVLFDNIDKDWSYVILALENDEQFKFAYGDVSRPSESDAQEQLWNFMSKFANEGKITETLFKLPEDKIILDKPNLIITDINDEIKKYFNKNPHKLYELEPRKFEELIASILEDMGFNVELTKATRDGGRDIIASIRNAVTNFLAYVECKKYAPENKVGVGIIRQVSGVHYLKKPAKSIIVTTSFFTADAQREAKELENQLDLKDYDDIKHWLNKY